MNMVVQIAWWLGKANGDRDYNASRCLGLGSILFLWDDALTFQHFEKFHESESTATGSHTYATSR
jgi:hypothetical protein